MRAAAGDLKAARGYFEDGLRIRRRLADEDATSAQKQRDLSISFERLGDVSVAAGDLKAARGYFEDRLRISRRLADDDRTSAEKQRDLWVSYWRIADVLEKQEHSGEARKAWQGALDILDQMAARGLHISPGDAAFHERLRRRLGR